MLNSVEVTSLSNLIRDSFRIRENHDPVYVELSDNLIRFSSPQQQVLFGRRGSGKSCLLVHFLQTSKRDKQTLAIYIGVDEIKRLGFPDVLIRILLSLFRSLPGARRSIFSFRASPLRKKIADLQKLLDEPEEAAVSRKQVSESNQSATLSGKSAVQGELKASSKSGTETTSTYQSSKLNYLERHLQDFKDVLRQVLLRLRVNAYVLVDDFYLIRRDLQPHVVDYLHRLVRGTDAYLKVATIRHRTSLRVHDGQTIGVEMLQDVEEISLDKTFEDFDATHEYLHSMLQRMAQEFSGEIDVPALFNPDASRALTLASGGVPRDFLNIFVEAIKVSVRMGRADRLTPTAIYKAAASLSYRSKLASLREEAGYDSEALDLLFSDLVAFCLVEKKKTVFLVNHEDKVAYPAEHELLQQLMDFKLVHLVDSNTSAASGRSGRFAAYTLDFSVFMEPRRRGIDIVEFWKTDEQRRAVGVRESPEYPLSRVKDVLTKDVDVLQVDAVLESLEPEDGGVDGRDNS